MDAFQLLLLVKMEWMQCRIGAGETNLWESAVLQNAINSLLVSKLNFHDILSSFGGVPALEPVEELGNIERILCNEYQHFARTEGKGLEHLASIHSMVYHSECKFKKNTFRNVDIVNQSFLATVCALHTSAKASLGPEACMLCSVVAYCLKNLL